MKNNLVAKEMAEVQLFSIKSIFQENEEKEKEIGSTFLKQVAATSEDIVAATLGKTLGGRLKRFASEIDLDHPGLDKLFDRVFSNDNKFSQTCCEVMTVAEFALDKGLGISNKLHHLITEAEQEKLCKDIKRCVDAPSKNQLHVRFLPTREQRDAIRVMKRMQIMELGTIAKRGQELWDCLPNSFMNYIRGRNVHEDSIKDGQEKADFLASLGVDGIAESIRDEVNSFKQQVEDTYYGFNRILMTNASIIQAKILGFNMRKCPVRNNWIITAPENYFDGFKFFDGAYGALDFNPRSYTYNEMQDVVPDKTKQIIDRLENFPEAGGKALFDHFRVLVPTVNYPPRGGMNNSSSINVDGKSINGTFNEIARTLDKELISRGFLCPILIGEKDEKGYFISYWC